MARGQELVLLLEAKKECHQSPIFAVLLTLNMYLGSRVFKLDLAGWLIHYGIWNLDRIEFTYLAV